jgi:hypothetical protein
MRRQQCRSWSGRTEYITGWFAHGLLGVGFSNTVQNISIMHKSASQLSKSRLSPEASELARQRPLLHLMSSALAPTELRGFLLTRHWRDLPDGTEIEYWLATDEGPKKVLMTRQTSVAFLPD